jgi:hypothetical protein
MKDARASLVYALHQALAKNNKTMDKTPLLPPASAAVKSYVKDAIAPGPLMRETPEEAMAFLEKWHLGAAGVLALEIVIFVAVSSGALSDVQAPLHIGPHAPFRNASSDVNIVATTHSFPIQSLSVVFLVLAIADHLYCVWSTRRNSEWYRQATTLSGGAPNTARWLEYSLSASVMVVQIAILNQIFDVMHLFCLFGLMATCMTFGYQQEMAGSTTLRPFWLGCVPYVVVWLDLGFHFFAAVSRSDAPDFVWAIVFVLFALMSLFALLQWAYYTRYVRKWQRSVYEWGFILLSFGAKSALAILVFAGTYGASEAWEQKARG